MILKLVGSVQIARILGAIIGAVFAYMNNPTWRWLTVISLGLGLISLVYTKIPIKGEEGGVLLGIGVGSVITSWLLYNRIY